GALGERIDIPDGPVDPPEVTVHEKDAQPHGHDEQREHADQVVANERLAVLPSEPMPAADEHDAAVEPDGDHEAEKDEAAKADYASAEIIERLSKAETRDRPGHSAGEHRIGVSRQDQRQVEQH